MLDAQSNLASTYKACGQIERSLQMHREVYFGYLEAFGEEHKSTITTASNYAITLCELERYAETKAVLRKMMPVAQRFLGENNYLTLKMRGIHATVLYMNTDATLDDLREAVTTLEDSERTARRILGSSHPTAAQFEHHLRNSRDALRAREDGRSIKFV